MYVERELWYVSFLCVMCAAKPCWLLVQKLRLRATHLTTSLCTVWLGSLLLCEGDGFLCETDGRVCPAALGREPDSPVFPCGGPRRLGVGHPLSLSLSLSLSFSPRCCMHAPSIWLGFLTTLRCMTPVTMGAFFLFLFLLWNWLHGYRVCLESFKF